jgi:hypothetical protein
MDWSNPIPGLLAPQKSWSSLIGGERGSHRLS